MKFLCVAGLNFPLGIFFAGYCFKQPAPRRVGGSRIAVGPSK